MKVDKNASLYQLTVSSNGIEVSAVLPLRLEIASRVMAGMRSSWGYQEMIMKNNKGASLPQTLARLALESADALIDMHNKNLDGDR